MTCNHEWTERTSFQKSMDDWGRFYEKWQRRNCTKCGEVEERKKPSTKDRRDAHIEKLWLSREAEIRTQIADDLQRLYGNWVSTLGLALQDYIEKLRGNKSNVSND